MKKNPKQQLVRPAAFVASAALVATGLALDPTATKAAAGLVALVTCSTSTPCASWQNKGSGTGLQSTAVGDAIRGVTSGKTKSGVYGETDNAAGGYGVHGTNKSSSGVAVYANGGPGVSFLGTSSGGIGMAHYLTGNGSIGFYSQAQTGTAIYGYGVGAGSGVLGYSALGVGVTAQSGSASSNALEADSFGTSAGMFQGDGAHIGSSSGNGAVIANGPYTANGISAVVGHDSVRFGEVVGGKSFGLIATTGAGAGGYPLEASSATSNGTVTGFFYVDGSGGIHYTGNLVSYAKTRDGANVTAFETKSTQASVEDSGTARLVAGNATVQLDPSFARSMDLTSPYRVFLTPAGDTRGLFVAQKSATSFVVRETQGGRGTLRFDYRILATAAGHIGERMTAVTPAIAAKAFPMLRAHGAPSSYTGMAPQARPVPQVARP